MDEKSKVKAVYRKLLEAAEGAGILVEDGSGKHLEDGQCIKLAETLSRYNMRGYISQERRGNEGPFTVVFINPALSTREKAETLAHELAHFFFHLPGYDAFSSPPHVRMKKEGQAERFSSWLLDFALSMEGGVNLG